MKIDIHSSVIGWLCSSELYNSLNEVVNRIAEMDGTVKKGTDVRGFFTA